MVLYNLGAYRSSSTQSTYTCRPNISLTSNLPLFGPFFWPLFLGLPYRKGESRRDGRVWGVKRKLPLLGQWTGGWPWGWAAHLPAGASIFWDSSSSKPICSIWPLYLLWASDQEWPQTDGSGWFLPDYIYKFGLFILMLLLGVDNI